MITANKTKKISVLGLVALAFLFLQYGCATILNGSDQTITVDSNVQGAEVLYNGKVIGVTPLSTTVEKHIDSILEIKKEGYQPQTIDMKTSLTAAFWGNILIGGLFGSSTDQSTDSAYEYDPGSFHVTLEPEQASQLELDSLMAEANLRRFILHNYTQIVREASTKQGEYLNTLSDLLSLKTDEQKSDLATHLLKLYGENSNPPAFAEKILILTRQSNTILQTKKGFR
jgi:hypothetical protein